MGAREVSSGGNDCVLVSDCTEYFYEALGALFAEIKPVNEDLVQLRVSFVSANEPFKHVEGIRMGTRRLDIKNKKIVQEIRTSGFLERWYRYSIRAVSKSRWFGGQTTNAEICEMRRLWLTGLYFREIC